MIRAALPFEEICAKKTELPDFSGILTSPVRDFAAWKQPPECA
jgi:hypothetical protein